MKRQFWFLARFGAYLAMNTLWPIVFLPVCKLAKRLGRTIFKFIFLVYPGTLDQVKGYVPLWYRALASMISVIGVVTGKYPGLVLTIPWTLEELEDENHRHERLARLARELTNLAENIGAESVALAGRLPGVLLRNGYELKKPFIKGEKGAVFTVVETVRQALDGTDPATVRIAVLGGRGFVGTPVVTSLRQLGGKVIAVDPRARNGKGTRDPLAVQNCDVVVVLTATGEQAETSVEYLKQGALVVDDTHPQLPRRIISAIKAKGGTVTKATLTLDGTRFLPRLPKWQPDWLPGCCVEAIVVAANNDTVIASQQDFDRLANKLGFQAIAVAHKSEL